VRKVAKLQCMCIMHVEYPHQFADAVASKMAIANDQDAPYSENLKNSIFKFSTRTY